MPVFELEANGKTFDVDAPSIDHAVAAFQKETASPQGYFATQRQMAGEGYEQATKGFSQIGSAWKSASEHPDEAQHQENIRDMVGGLGNAAAGSVNYVTSPINAGLRTAVGEPLEKLTGIPKEYSEFAASMLLPVRLPTSLMSKAGGAAKVAAPTVEALKDAARAGYQSEAVKGLQLDPQALSNWSNAARAALEDKGFVSELAPGTHAILKRAAGPIPDGSTVTGTNVDSLRKALGNAAKSSNSTERAAAVRSMEELDKFLPAVKPGEVIAGSPEVAASTLADARGNWSAASHAELLDKKQLRAELRAAAANSGQNVANSVRQRIADILVSDRERRGFSKQEIALMERVVNGSGAQNAIRALGNLMGGGGGALAAGYEVAGALGHGPLAAVPAVGFGLKKLSNALVGRDMDKLNELVRSNSPLGRRVAAPMVSWSKAVKAIESDASPRNLAMLGIASRNLSNNLKDVGVTVSPHELVRSLMPADSAAPPAGE